MSGPGPFDPGGDDPFAEMAQVFAQFVSSFGAGGSLDFEHARQMAATIANDGEPEPNVDPLERITLEGMARAAELHVVEITGLTLEPATARIEPVTRTQWTSATLDAYRPLFERLTDSLGSIMRSQLDQIPPEELGPLGSSMGPFGADPTAFLAGLSQLLGPMMLSMMAGSTVGHLGRRAFGSFDLPIPRPTGGVMVVAGNVDRFAADWSLPPDDLRMWICLSELTHRAILDVPHVANRLDSLLAAHAGAFQADDTSLEERLGDIDLADPSGMEDLQRLLADPDVVLGAIRSDHQRRLLSEIDAIVAVVEGYVDWVLDTIGSRLLSSPQMISEAMRRRRVETDQASRFIERLFGLELTQDTVDRGQAFVAGVVERAGPKALERLWSQESGLPTTAETEAPGLWLARTAPDADQPLPELDDEFVVPDFPDLDD